MNRKSKYLPKELTRKERKQRQNLLVWFGMSRIEAKALRSYQQFVEAYDELIEQQLDSYGSLDTENKTVNGSEEEFEDLLEKLNDGSFDPAATEFSTTAMANSILKGQMGLTTGDLKGVAPTTALLYGQKHYLPEVDPSYQEFRKKMGITDGS